MSKSISLFPTLQTNKKLQQQFRYEPEKYIFSYNHENNIYILDAELAEGTENTFNIIDNEHGLWCPDTYNLKIQRNYHMLTCRCLFGKDGIVCNDAIVGLAVKWASHDSHQRSAMRVIDATITNQDNEVDFRFQHDFGIGTLRGKIEFTTVLFIKQSGIPNEDEQHLANEVGCIVAELDTQEIVIDGTASDFPLYIDEKPGEPLWEVICNWEDATYDKFSETVAINLNKAHKYYKYIDVSNSKTYNTQLMAEIISAALCTVVAKVKEQNADWQAVLSGEDISPGSVAEAINYFINCLGWNLSTIESTSLSIRKFFEERMTIK